MKIACVGGGPGGLYFSILMKLHDPSHDITIYERNPAGCTYGWGVTYWGELLEKLQTHDPKSAQAVADSSVSWNDGVAHLRGTRTVQRGDQGCGIGRHILLDILAVRAQDLGVEILFEHQIDAAEAPSGVDLVVACDGANSMLREQRAKEFGTQVTVGRNPYIWLGTSKVFDSFTFDFVETRHGWIWCYAYPFSEDYSTFLVECAPETFAGLGLDLAADGDGLRLLETLFAGVLDGHQLIDRSTTGRSAQWLQFRTIVNRNWYRDNIVLLGDAAHTAHYSIGAGTTLALEDAMALADALRDNPPLGPALAQYQRERRAAILATQSAARYSAQWYENLERYISLPPSQMFALLGQRHSPLLPHVPPPLYYRLDHFAGQSASLRRFKRWLGREAARRLQSRR